MNEQEGNFLIIEDEKYEIIKRTQEIDNYYLKKEESIGEHWLIELHKVGDKSIRATHLVKKYFDKEGEAEFYEKNKTKPLNFKKIKIGKTLKIKPKEEWINKKILKIKLNF